MEKMMLKKRLKNWGNINKLAEMKRMEEKTLMRFTEMCAAFERKAEKAENFFAESVKENENDIKLARKSIQMADTAIKNIFAGRTEMENAISTLTEDEQILLYLKYMRKFSMKQIADRLFLSERAVFIIQNRAFEKLQKLL